MLLTIGQLADYCGVTVRAVRHYHRIGLLAEPERDDSGYRRYGAQAVVDLTRIKVLADGGVPLSQVQTMLAADPEQFTAAIDAIDNTLAQQIAGLQRRRRQLAGLFAGDRLVLPPEVADLLDQLRAIGVSGHTVTMERDGWTLVEALCPELASDWVDQKRAALADPEFRRLYLACDQARDWDPDDPRLTDLAAWGADWAATQHATRDGPDTSPAQDRLALVEELVAQQTAQASPALHRLNELGKALSSTDSDRRSTNRASSRTPDHP